MRKPEIGETGSARMRRVAGYTQKGAEMGKGWRLATVCTLGLAVAAGVVALFAALPALSQAHGVQQEPWLDNAGFEGPYVELAPELSIAPEWSLWYDDAAQYYAPPKAGPESALTHEGGTSQHVHNKDEHTGYDACLYQQVTGITVGHYIRFTAWANVADAHSWLDSPDKRGVRLGIDPSGGTDPRDTNPYDYPAYWDTHDAAEGQWQELAVVMKATSPTATAYLCAHPSLPRRLDVYWDDASFAANPERLVYMPILARHACNMPPGTLYNPGLERDYCTLFGYQTPISGYDNVRIAPYWTPFWSEEPDPDSGQNYRQPECNYVEAQYYPYRVHSGEVAQQCGLSGGGGFEAGLYQVITGTQVSDTIHFSMWGLGWTQDYLFRDPDYNERISDYADPDGLRFRVGIDPYGGTSYTSTDIVWSEFYDPYDQWHRFEVTATVAYTRVSVWAYANPHRWWLKWNQTWWDTASMTATAPLSP